MAYNLRHIKFSRCPCRSLYRAPSCRSQAPIWTRSLRTPYDPARRCNVSMGCRDVYVQRNRATTKPPICRIWYSRHCGNRSGNSCKGSHGTHHILGSTMLGKHRTTCRRMASSERCAFFNRGALWHILRILVLVDRRCFEHRCGAYDSLRGVAYHQTRLEYSNRRSSVRASSTGDRRGGQKMYATLQPVTTRLSSPQLHTEPRANSTHRIARHNDGWRSTSNHCHDRIGTAATPQAQYNGAHRALQRIRKTIT